MEEQVWELDRGAAEGYFDWLPLEGVAVDVDRESGAPESYGRTAGSVEERLNKLNWDDFGFGLDGALCWTLTVLEDSGDGACAWVSMMVLVFELST